MLQNCGGKYNGKGNVLWMKNWRQTRSLIKKVLCINWLRCWTENLSFELVVEPSKNEPDVDLNVKMLIVLYGKYKVHKNVNATLSWNGKSYWPNFGKSLPTVGKTIWSAIHLLEDLQSYDWLVRNGHTKSYRKTWLSSWICTRTMEPTWKSLSIRTKCYRQWRRMAESYTLG